MNSNTLEALRVSTKQLIESEKNNIALTRKATYADDGIGGRQSLGPSRKLPPVERFFSGTVSQELFIVDETGQRLEATHVLIGLPGDDIQKNDTFEEYNVIYRVVYVDPLTKHYQTKGYCISVDAGN